MDEPQENTTEFWETSSYTNLIRKKSNQTISIWWIGNSENINLKRMMLCVTILFHHLVCFCVHHLGCVIFLLCDVVIFFFVLLILFYFSFTTAPKCKKYSGLNHLCCVHKPKSIPFISSTIVHLIHFIDHSSSLSWLPYLVILMLYCHFALLSQYIKKHDFA